MLVHQSGGSIPHKIALNMWPLISKVFMIGSSLLSFFVPCLAMIALYAVIFRRLREREKARDMRKRGPTLGVDNALILNALMGGARMARWEKVKRNDGPILDSGKLPKAI